MNHARRRRRCVGRNSRGRQDTLKVEPCPSSDFTCMKPPCFRTIVYYVESPSPVPLPISLVLKKRIENAFANTGRDPRPRVFHVKADVGMRTLFGQRLRW